MKKVLSLLVFMAFAIASNSQTTDEVTVKNKFTEYLTPRLDGRKLDLTVFSGDLNGDGLSDFVISYCIQATDDDRNVGGGNAMMNLVCMQEGIAVYIKSGNEYSLKAEKSMDNFKVYTENEISFKVKNIDKGRILCESTAYGPDDANCCPSVVKNVFVKYDNGKLVKQEL